MVPFRATALGDLPPYVSLEAPGRSLGGGGAGGCRVRLGFFFAPPRIYGAFPQCSTGSNQRRSSRTSATSQLSDT